ncbi:hypothetical protein SAMN05421678_1146 [Actinopolymorpha cephalotaxi]|uniref:Uncharacterized protein n=1 Tax=Actinopolymorpha cephalotaxi TaxID=504797 RepID=A0A1I2YB87_9ACTN|nr:replication initiator [Actinopolymorpha cephalotaxi]NYH87057.1 hypothetical protein [Actinopolymorpha cephalotaxi]SFH22892.1 hypothetical protein SAMN05421678_1146 [Actinopolymorpha cephalotaxi]
MTRHRGGDEQLGRPLCPDCYDYDHHAVWNTFAGELWRYTTMKANRELRKWARRHGHAERVENPDTGKVERRVPVRISFGKAAEFQRRGLVHFHILARFDGIPPSTRTWWCHHRSGRMCSSCPGSSNRPSPKRRTARRT